MTSKGLSRSEVGYYEGVASSWLEKIDQEQTPHSHEKWDRHETHAIQKGRFTGCPVTLYTEEEDEEDRWGVVLDGDQVDELDEGDIVEIQIVTRNGKTWPSTHEIFCIVEDVAFAQPLEKE